LWNADIKDVPDFQTLSLTELIQELTEDIREHERELLELERRGRISKVSACVALILYLLSTVSGSTPTYIDLLWLALASGSALVAFVSFKRRALTLVLIGQSRFYRSIVIEEAYTGKDIGPKI